MADKWHVRWLMEGTSHWNLRRKNVKFRPDLSGINFAEISQSSPNPDSFFEGIDLKYANLKESNLDGMSFSGAQFFRSDLSAASMNRSKFNRARFNQAKLSNASAKESSFEGAEFKSANLTDAQFDNSTMVEVNFQRSNLSTSQAEQFFSYEQVKLPDGFVPPEGWDVETISIPDFFSMHRAEEAVRERSVLAKLTGGVIEGDGNKFASSADTANSTKFSAIYSVYYATNRRPIFKENRVVSYGGQRSQGLDYGVCNVGIPKGHRVGSIGSNWWKRIRNGDDRLKLNDLIQLNQDLYWEHMKTCLEKSGLAEGPILFVHGYNNSFSDAVIRAAQIGYDLGIGNGIGLFSWPSAGKKKAYAADETSMEASKYLLADHIEDYVNKTDADNLNIIAHSMGCRCFLLAAEVLASDRQHILQKLGQVVLAAADVDQGIMQRLSKQVVGSAKRMSNYVSDKDYALEASSWLHSFPRVGLAPPAYVMPRMDTILVNSFDLSSLGHGYIADSRKVLSDIYNVLKHNHAPTSRFTVEEVISSPLSYWQIKA